MAARLGDVALVQAAQTEDETIRLVQVGGWSALVVDHASSALDGPGLMDRMAATRPPGLRLVACLARGAGPEVPGLLVGSLGVPSTSEARRLIAQGGVKLDGEAVGELDLPRERLVGAQIQVGKRRYATLTEG